MEGSLAAAILAASTEREYGREDVVERIHVIPSKATRAQNDLPAYLGSCQAIWSTFVQKSGIEPKERMGKCSAIATGCL